MNGGRRTKACDFDHLLLSPKVSDRLLDGRVDRWARGQENANDLPPTWIMLDFLDQSFLSHEFINSKPLGVGGARVLQDACQDPPNAWAIAAKNDEPSAFRVG